MEVAEKLPLMVQAKIAFFMFQQVSQTQIHYNHQPTDAQFTYVSLDALNLFCFMDL